MMYDMMPSSVRVLDVGCGTGSVTEIANRGRGNTIVAIEPDRQRAEIAQSRGISVHVGLLDEKFLAQNRPFDVVMSSDVLEHVAAPAQLLKLMTRALVPGGILIVSVPNVAHWSVRLNLLRGRFDYEPVGIMDATHLRWFTKKTLTALLEMNGLSIIDIRQTAGTDLPIYQRGLLRRLPSRAKVPAIRSLTKSFPLLFGVRHVVKARPMLP